MLRSNEAKLSRKQTKQQCSNRDLKVIPLVNTVRSSEFEFLPKPLPRPSPCRILVIGSCASGKTNLIMNLITRFWLDNDGDSIFDEIYVFAPSILQDKSFSPLKDFEDIVYANNSLDTELIREIISREDDVRKLVYIDDFANSPQIQGEILHDLFFISRHSNTSVIFSSQYYYKVPIPIRCNASHLILFKPQSKKEMGLIRAELQTIDFPDKSFDEAYKMATKEKYSFLYIDRFTEGKPTFYINFDTKIEPNNDDEEDDDEEEEKDEMEIEDEVEAA